jgi:hypothetical protein
VKHNEYYFRFHFKGYYLGYKVQEVVIKSLNDSEFEIGEEYLLWVKRQSIESGILKVEPIKYKKIGE